MQRVQHLSSPPGLSPAARAMELPLSLALRPTLAAPGAETLAVGRVGDLQWQALVACGACKDMLPAFLRVRTDGREPLVLPCSVSPGRRFWRLRVSMEPTPIQTWPDCPSVTPAELVAAVVDAARSPWVDQLDWMFPMSLAEDLRGLSLPPHASLRDFQTWVIPLQREYDAVFKTFKGNTRREIRYAREKGVRVVADPTREQLLQFARLWRSSCQERGWTGPFYSEDFFLAIPRRMGTMSQIVLAEAEGRIIGGAHFLDEGRGAFHYLGAMDRAYKDHFPMMAIFDHVLRGLCVEGKEYLNLGGVGPNQDLAVFKQKWGAERRLMPVLRCSREASPLPAPLRAANAALRRVVSLVFRIYRHRHQRALAREVQP